MAYAKAITLCLAKPVAMPLALLSIGHSHSLHSIGVYIPNGNGYALAMNIYDY